MNRKTRRLEKFKPKYYAEIVSRTYGQTVGTAMTSAPVNYATIGNHTSGTRNRVLVSKEPKTEKENN